MAFDIQTENSALETQSDMTDASQGHKKVRKNESYLSRYEAPALLWIASRIPDSVSSDHMTLLGLGGAFLAAIGFALSNFSPMFLWLAPLGLMLNWFGDSLDGTLARVRKNERPQLGYFIDHTSDILAQLAIGLGCGLSPYVRLDMACLALIGYLTLVALTFIRASVSGVTRIAYFGLGPTEIRLFLIVASLYFFFFGQFAFDIAGFSVRLSDAVTFMIFVGAISFFVGAARQDLQNIRDNA